MQPLFSTLRTHPRNSFQLWRDVLRQRQVPIETARLDDSPFEGRLDVAEIGPFLMSRIAQSNVRSEATSGLLRTFGKTETLIVMFKLAGLSTVQQDERSTVQRQGDLCVLDHRPATLISGAACQTMFLELPRERLEQVLGPTRLYTALRVGGELASTALTTAFFAELIRIRRQLAPEAAAQMTAIGVDLIVASLAERLAQEVPHTSHGTIVVQRAKAHVAAHLGDASLDPAELAAAVGVSLRRLQELFHARGRHISDYIWEQRLEAAAQRLTDPACAQLSIGQLACECGFTSQAHFARRFKDRHGLTPRDYRLAAQEHRLRPEAEAHRPG